MILETWDIEVIKMYFNKKVYPFQGRALNFLLKTG